MKHRRKTNIIPYTEQDFKETNGDRIRKMTDEQLACYIRQCACCEYEHDGEKCVLDNCTAGIVKWLKKEAHEDD